MSTDKLIVSYLLNNPEMAFEVAALREYTGKISQAVIDATLRLIKEGHVPTAELISVQAGIALDYLDACKKDVADIPLETLAKQVRGAYVRQVVRQVGQSLSKGEIRSYEELQKEVASAIGTLTSLPKGENQDSRSLLERATDNVITELFTNRVLVETPVDALNDMIGGFAKGEYTVLAGRPGMGKTAFAAQIRRGLLMGGVPVISSSMDQAPEELIRREGAILAKVPLIKVYKGTLSQNEKERVAEAIKVVKSWPWYISTTRWYPTFELEVMETLEKYEGKVAMLDVDYIQLMFTDGAHNRTNEVSRISAGLKGLGIDNGMAVVCVSQLSRAPEGRADKRPQPSDLRDSGSLEQDADKILFIYRDHYYNPDTADPRKAEILIPKNKAGALGMVYADWNWGVFGNWDESDGLI